MFDVAVLYLCLCYCVGRFFVFLFFVCCACFRVLIKASINFSNIVPHLETYAPTPTPTPTAAAAAAAAAAETAAAAAAAEATVEAAPSIVFVLLAFDDFRALVVLI